MSIESKTSEFQALSSRITIANDLIGGTKTMREAGERHLPKLGVEDADGYKKRLAVSVLYPAFAETVKQMVGRVFFSPIVREKIEIDEAYVEDFDRSNNDIDKFLSEPFRHGVSYGRAYVIVTAPSGSEAKTKAEEKLLNIRPYAIAIDPSNVLGIKRKNGVITEFRYLSATTEVNEAYEEITTKRIIIHQPGICLTYIQIEDEWSLESQVEIKGRGGTPLPFVPVAELMLEKNELPLEHLAYLNIKHWQSQSDQDNILKYARVPILKTIGIDDDTQVQVGGTATNLPEGADMSWVEHSGAAIGAGRESLEDLKLEMHAAGAKLLVRTKLAMTDSQAKEEQTKEISILRKYANNLEDFSEHILYFFAAFEGKETGGRIEITGNMDGDFDMLSSMERVNEGHRNGYVSSRTAFEELQRRGMVTNAHDWETEQTRIEAEGLVSDEEPAI